MKLSKTLRRNIQRVDLLIEGSFHQCSCCDVPLPSWVEIGLNDFCTRRCEFCPKGDDAVAPNLKHLLMSPRLIKKIAQDLSDIGFSGVVMLAGYGEPLATPHLIEAIETFSKVCRVEITTNGDILTEALAESMAGAGISKIVVSMYDGPEQEEKFRKIFTSAGIARDRYILRDRWYGAASDFGLKLTNRAGAVRSGNQPQVNYSAKCHYPHYSMMIDWNGDVFLCTQDWNRRIKTGNLAFSSVHDIWTGDFYRRYRQRLFQGDRSLSPCSNCNCAGRLHGDAHARAWQTFYDQQKHDGA